MTKIDIFSGFLGAGKTTLIKKLIKEAYEGEKIVIIENEFGEIGIDGGFLKDSGIQVNEMNSGCICCSLVGDFGVALKQVLLEYAPDRILIEPSGVGKLSDVIKAVKDVETQNACLNAYATVVDANKCKMYMKNFGEFFNDQIKSAGCIVLSHTDNIGEEKIRTCIDMIKEHNKDAVIVTTPWRELEGKLLLEAIERSNSLETEMKEIEHHHHHHEHGEECHCGHHHEHGEECHCGHHHEHGEECHCGHHHHHADEVFTSWGKETVNKYTIDEINTCLEELIDNNKYGMVLRAKGIVCGEDGQWINFDYVPGEADVRIGNADVTGRICVIGAGINEEEITKLFRTQGV